jgi:hypothetical protein
MNDAHEAMLTPDALKTQLKVMADIELSQQAIEMFDLLAGIVLTMNMLQPEGYSQTFPAFTFQPMKE